ncbi:MAG TPA: YigZ family protein, partial [Erysipelothrix sp.]|nr:YigZ family protein [Erysipelothrix sp.]
GLPMLQMLQAHDLNYVLAVVIRYFGGIKLGVGGLIRAYSSSVQQAIEQAALFEKTIVYQVMVEIDFDQLSIIETQLNNQAEIKERFYSDKAGFELEVYDLTLLDKLYDLSNGRLIIVDQQPVEKWIEMKKSL